MACLCNSLSLSELCMLKPLQDPQTFDLSSVSGIHVCVFVYIYISLRLSICTFYGVCDGNPIGVKKGERKNKSKMLED